MRKITVALLFLITLCSAFAQAQTVTLLPNGVNTVTDVDFMAKLPTLDPSRLHLYYQEFNGNVISASTLVTTDTDWPGVTITADYLLTSTHIVGETTEAISQRDGGIFEITTGDGDNDNRFYQTAEMFKFESGKELWFASRLKINDASEAEFVMGLQLTDTAPLDVTDGVFFRLDDGDRSLDFDVEQDSTATATTGVVTLTDDTYLEVAFYYDGLSTVEYWVDNYRKGTVATTNLPDDEELAISFGIQNGEAEKKVLYIDYIFVAKER